MQTKRHEILSIPNILSFIRILLIPVCILLYLNAQSTMQYIHVGIILALSCITDMLDGLIARKCNMITTLGKILDPVADKGTQFAMMMCLAIKHQVMWSIIPLFVVKEGFQLIVGAIHYKRGKMLSGALMTGKVCTTILFASTIILIVFPDMSSLWVTIITSVCAVFLILSFASYIMAYYGKNKKIEDLKT